MGRWLLRLLIIGLILFAVSRIVSRVLGSDEDFDDFDDIDDGMEFAETPVEIDIPAPEAASSAPTLGSTSASSETASDTVATFAPSSISDTVETSTSADADTGSNGSGRSVIDVNGIGPTYAGRLGDAGIHTMQDLATADAGDLADKIEVIGGRAEIEDWIRQAKEFTSGGAAGGE